MFSFNEKKNKRFIHLRVWLVLSKLLKLQLFLLVTMKSLIRRMFKFWSGILSLLFFAGIENFALICMSANNTYDFSDNLSLDMIGNSCNVHGFSYLRRPQSKQVQHKYVILGQKWTFETWYNFWKENILDVSKGDWKALGHPQRLRQAQTRRQTNL